MKEHKTGFKLVPAAFVLGYIPLIVRLHVYDSHFEAFDWFPAWEDGMMYDFFLYYKAAAVIITAAVMLFIMLFSLLVGNTKRERPAKTFSPVLIALLGYLFFVFISGILSEHRPEAFSGSAESFESVPVILSYGIIFIYAYNTVRDKESLRKMLKLSLPGFVLIGIMSLLQLINADPFKSSFIKAITVPGKYADIRDSIVFTYQPGEVYATLYNSNYVAQYFGFGLFAGLSLVILNKDIRMRLAGLAAFLVSLCAIIGSRSRTGYIAVVISLILFFFFIPRCCDGRAAGICRITSFIIAGAVVVTIPVVYFAGMMPTVLHKAGVLREGETDFPIKDVKTGADGVRMVMHKGTLLLSYETDGGECIIDMADEDGKEPAYELSEDMTGYILKDKRFKGMRLYPVFVEDKVCLCVNAGDRELVFLNDGSGYLYYNGAGKFSDFKHYERSALFSDSLFSDRGLLWNNCISLLPKYILKGSGTGTFAYVYPNDDDYYRLYNDTGFNFYDVKAHSLYFQQFIENGGIAFLFFLVFCISFAVSAVRSKDPAVFAIFAGSVCYLLCSLTVDSNVNTAPVFWVLTGAVAGVTRTE